MMHNKNNANTSNSCSYSNNCKIYNGYLAETQLGLLSTGLLRNYLLLKRKNVCSNFLIETTLGNNTHANMYICIYIYIFIETASPVCHDIFVIKIKFIVYMFIYKKNVAVTLSQ